MARAGDLPSVAFYYGARAPMDVLQAFDWVIVDPKAAQQAKTLERPHTRLFAYVSLGEAFEDRQVQQALPAACRLGENRVWHAIIVDQSRPECRAFYLDKVIEPLLARGYRNFFLDTLDSYRLALKGSGDRDQRRAYRQGLVDLIKAVHQRDPGGQLILNRGFELLDAVRDQGVVGVAAESLYRGWDQRTKSYVRVTAEATDYLLGQFDHVRQLGMVPIAIDYLPARQSADARELAQRIAGHGIAPYVTNGALDIVGSGSISPMPRRILLLYNGAYAPMNNNLNWYAAMPLNHMGYATREIDVSSQPLPGGPLAGQVAGIVTWFDTDTFPQSARTWRWLREQMQAGVPVAVLGQFGLGDDGQQLHALGLHAGSPLPPGLHAARVLDRAPDYFGFETPLLPSAPDFSPLEFRDGSALLRIGVAGHREDAAAITPWGGYVLNPYVLRNLPKGDLKAGQLQSSWILDPFRFFRAALRLPDVPAYDFTTASGRRLLFALIDGDGFTSASWIAAFRGEPAAQVILDQVLEPYRLPVTVSVIAGEFIDDGLYPKAEVDRMRPIARKIFALPWVEIGSHTYSHPFDWPALENNPGLSAGLHLKPGTPTGGGYVAGAKPALQYGYNLPVPGYRFSPRMEVTGSTKIINRLLAPRGKRVRVIQWSGDTNPGAEALDIANQDGLANINGNNSTILRARPSLTNVAPLGVWKGAHFQVYSPIANEDQYTHGWQSTFSYCGYKNAIQTMQMTGSPRRLAAMEVYYHFYSGARDCALKNLVEVYHWALKQASTPVYASTYSRIAVDFQSAGLARTADGYLARGYAADQELRIPDALGYPDLQRSRNVAGYDSANGQRYIHLGSGNEARLVLAGKPPDEPYLASANGLIESMHRGPGQLDLTLRAHVPLSFTLANTAGCRIRVNGRPPPSRHVANGKVSLKLAGQGADIEVRCAR